MPALPAVAYRSPPSSPPFKRERERVKERERERGREREIERERKIQMRRFYVTTYTDGWQTIN